MPNGVDLNSPFELADCRFNAVVRITGQITTRSVSEGLSTVTRLHFGLLYRQSACLDGSKTSWLALDALESLRDF